MSVNQVSDISCAFPKTQHHAWHQIANDDQVAYAYAKALYRDGGIENYSSVRVCELAKRKERRLAPLEVACTSRLQVQSKAGAETGPYDNDGPEEDAHLREGARHG